MIFLLDANTLITVKNQHYQLTKVPEFWDWLIYQGNLGNIKIPIETYDEFKDTFHNKKLESGETIKVKDDLALWASKPEVKDALIFNEEADMELVNQVLKTSYTENPSEDELIKMGNDPFLISYALFDKESRCIISGEVSKPKRVGANTHVPNACDRINVKCSDLIGLIDYLGFSTSWSNEI